MCNNMTTQNIPDYGHNGRTKEGLWLMHPSGDLVTTEEKEKRLSANAKARRIQPSSNEIFGMSWRELEMKQGGRLVHK